MLCAAGRPSSSAAGRLQIDSGVLRAFLEVGRYRHGARSLETIISMSTLSGKNRFERSALPAAKQLDAHVNAKDFLSLVERYVPEGDLLERLAEAAHVSYCGDMLAAGLRVERLARLPGRVTGCASPKPAKKGPHPSLVDYGSLPPDVKEQNRGNARDLARKLAFLGYSLREDAPAGAPAVRLRSQRSARRAARKGRARALGAGQDQGRLAPRPEGRREAHASLHLPVGGAPRGGEAEGSALVLGIPEIVAASRDDAGQGRGDGRAERSASAVTALSPSPRKLVAGIEQALRRIEAAFPGRPLRILSALAEGADRLALGPALERPGSKLVAVLPLEKYDYLSDFESSESKDEFLRLLARADEVVELPAQAERKQAYEAGGDFICEQADVLLAVWDGQDGQGQGGTATVVARARERGLPIAWVHAGNRKPGTLEPTSLGDEQGSVSYENF